METVKTSGYTLEKEDERFISVSWGVRKIKLGDTVISNGRIFVPKGIKGVVVRIFEPFTRELSTDVIAVQWEGREDENFMKFKDFDWEAMKRMRSRPF